jgi:hypothetical protein
VEQNAPPARSGWRSGWRGSDGDGQIHGESS